MFFLLLFVCAFAVMTPRNIFAGAPCTTPILMYHEVIEVGPATVGEQRAFSITPRTFEMQMRYLHDHNYQTVFVRDVAAYVRAGKRLPQRLVALTFDDGTVDVAETVLPILKKFGLKATIYVNPGFDGVNVKFKLLVHHPSDSSASLGLVLDS